MRLYRGLGSTSYFIYYPLSPPLAEAFMAFQWLPSEFARRHSLMHTTTFDYTLHLREQYTDPCTLYPYEAPCCADASVCILNVIKTHKIYKQFKFKFKVKVNTPEHELYRVICVFGAGSFVNTQCSSPFLLSFHILSSCAARTCAHFYLRGGSAVQKSLNIESTERLVVSLPCSAL